VKLRLAVPVFVLIMSGLAACDDDAATGSAGAVSTTTTRPEPVEGLLATVATNRLYVTRHAFGVGLQNVGDAPVVVRSARLDSELFEAAPTGEEQVQLEPGGRRFVVPVPYGEPRCGDVAPTFAVLVVLADGRELRVPAVEEFPGAILRVHERDCFAADVHERVDLRFGDEWTQDGIAIAGDLLLDQRHPGEPVVVDDARGNVIFTLVIPEDPPILRVDDDEPSARLPITISADRCDPHAVAEFKRPYVMLTWIAIGDSAPVPVELEATGAARTALDVLIASCSTG
jgi:hypothetical protein